MKAPPLCAMLVMLNLLLLGAVCRASVEEQLDAVTLLVEVMEGRMREMAEEIEELRDTKEDFKRLARQTMMLQHNIEERVRSDGDSGIKLVQAETTGPANYYEAGIMADAANSAHDHSNYDRTLGMGPTVTVLNGVEFITRHNDYKLNMPHTHSDDYHAVENIPFPGVPEEVTGKETVEEQVTEMREWFKAFQHQNSSLAFRGLLPASAVLHGGGMDTGKEVGHGGHRGTLRQRQTQAGRRQLVRIGGEGTVHFLHRGQGQAGEPG